MKIRFPNFREAVLLSVLFLGSVFLALPTKAFDAPRIYIKELNISQTSFKAGDNINGDFLMWNTSRGIAADLSYAVSLDQGYNSISKETYPISGQIAPDKTLRQAFSYTIPKNFNSGVYTLKIQLFSQSGMPLNWGTKDIKIEGTGGYLNIAGSYVMQGEKAFDPTVGPSFKAGESVKIKFTVYNPAAQKIDFKPQVAVYSFQDNSKELEHFSGLAYSLNPKETKNVEIGMPKYQNPGSYLAKVVLFNQNDPVSNEVSFRWVVAGAGARILNVSVKSNVLEAGKEVKASVDYTGPADSTDVGEAKLAIKLYNAKNGQTIASGEKTIQLGKNTQSEIFSLIPNSNADSFTAEVKITKDGKELASYSANIKNPDDINNGKRNSALSEAKTYLALLAILVIILVIFLFRKKMINGKNLLLLLVLVGAGLLTTGTTDVQAAVSTCAAGDGCVLGCSPTPDPDCSTLDLTWNAPMKDTIYIPGDAIIYEGQNNNASCFNNVSMLQADSYVCDINKANCIQNGSEKKYIAESSKMTYNQDDGKLYVLDSETGNARIVRVDLATKIQELFPGVSEGDGSFDPGQLHEPQGIFYSSPYLYIADTGNNRIVRFDPNNMAGTWQVWTTSVGGTPFNAPWGIVFQSHYMYVTDSGNNRIVRYSFSSNSWDQQYDGSSTGTTLSNPGGISFSGTHIYAADTGNNRIVRFKPNDTGWQVFTTDGSVTLSGPKDAFYSSPNLYVMDTDNDRVVTFDPDVAGAWTTFGGVFGSGVGQFGNAKGIFYRDSYIYVGDGWNNKRIVRFDPSNMAGSWDTFDFSPKAYNIDAGVPLVVGRASFVKADGVTDYDGDGLPDPLGAVYAKIHSHVGYVIGGTDDADSFERIIINTTPAGSCPGVPNPVDADGNPYNTVQIGAQCWMKQNMNVGAMTTLCSGGYAGGPCDSVVPAQTLNSQTVTSGIQKYCYNDDPYKCTANGGLYQWAEAMNLDNSCNSSTCVVSSPQQGICPVGWHIPTDNEQYILESGLTDSPNPCDPNRTTPAPAWEGCANAGTKLQVGGSTGFNGVLNGDTTSLSYTNPFNDSTFVALNWVGGLWSSTQDLADGSQAWHRHLYNAWSSSPSGAAVMRHQGPKKLSDGVRCILDSTPPVVPVAESLKAISPDYCVKPPQFSLQWTYKNSSGADQDQYNIQVSTNSSFTGLVVDATNSENVSPDGTGTAMLMVVPSPTASLTDMDIGYNSTYYWRLKVKDTNGNWSAWVNYDDPLDLDGNGSTNSITTHPHAYPDVGFVPPSPSFFTINQPISFKTHGNANPGDNSTCYDNSNVGSLANCSTWRWDFGDGTGLHTPPAGANGNMTYTYTTPSTGDGYNVKLYITDASGKTCSNPDDSKLLKTVKPNWKEVIPR